MQVKFALGEYGQTIASSYFLDFSWRRKTLLSVYNWSQEQSAPTTMIAQRLVAQLLTPLLVVHLSNQLSMQHQYMIIDIKILYQ